MYVVYGKKKDLVTKVIDFFNEAFCFDLNSIEFIDSDIKYVSEERKKINKTPDIKEYKMLVSPLTKIYDLNNKEKYKLTVFFDRSF